MSDPAVTPQPKIIPLEAPCLRAARQSLRIVTVKPFGRLTVSDTLGPHFGGGDRHEAFARATAFLTLASQENAKIAVAPEYFTPRETLEDVIRNPGVLREECVFILPLESLDRAAHGAMIALGKAEQWDVIDAETVDSQAGTSLNSCALIYRDRGRNQLFFQHKVYASPLETTMLIAGKEFFVFEGSHMRLIVLICSDGNSRRYHQIWADAAARKPGFYMAHVQWNPSSDYSEYGSLWGSILSPEQCERRLIISCNWANGSVIEGVHVRNSTSRFRTRMFRRRSHLEPTSFKKQSKYGMHVEHHKEGKDKWEIWHSLPNSEHALVLDLVRPYENVPCAELSREHTIRQAWYFDRNGQEQSFIESCPRRLGNPFWDLMCRLGVDQDQREELESFTLHDVELIYNAGMIREKYSWISEDVAYRLPTAPVLCPVRECSQCAENLTTCRDNRAKWEKEAEDFAECLRFFWASKNCRTKQLKIGVCSEYPLNLELNDGTPAGWLFHAKGRCDTRLARALASLLKDKLRDNRRTIFLCGVGVGGQMPTESQIHDSYRKIDEPEGPSHDILNPKGCTRLKIVNPRS